MSALVERRDSTAEAWWRGTLRALAVPSTGCTGPLWIADLSASTRALQLQSSGATTRSIESPQPAPEGGTGRVEDFGEIAGALAALGELVAPEDLEYGMETPLIPALYRLVRMHGEGAVLELAASIESKEMDPQIASWILRWLGRLPNHATHQVRRWLLERSLHSAVPAIRDGAVLGLASLGDRRALPALQAALSRERYSRLQRNIEKTLRQVERSA